MSCCGTETQQVTPRQPRGGGAWRGLARAPGTHPLPRQHASAPSEATSSGSARQCPQGGCGRSSASTRSALCRHPASQVQARPRRGNGRLQSNRVSTLRRRVSAYLTFWIDAVHSQHKVPRTDIWAVVLPNSLNDDALTRLQAVNAYRPVLVADVDLHNAQPQPVVG